MSRPTGRSGRCSLAASRATSAACPLSGGVPVPASPFWRLNASRNVPLTWRSRPRAVHSPDERCRNLLERSVDVLTVRERRPAQLGVQAS